jgi:uncharacterized protein involved in exopolysaccharide biosynthesis
MMEEMKNKNQEMAGEEEISLLDYWRVIQKHGKLIGRIVLVTVVLTAVVSLFMKNIYQVKVVIAPIAGKEGTTSSTASMLAQQFGIVQSGPAPGTEIFNLLNSNILKHKIIEKNDLLPVLFEDNWDKEKNTWKRGGFSLNPMRLVRIVSRALNPPPTSIKKDPGVPDTWDGIRALMKITKVTQNLKENTITITTEYKDPVMAANLGRYTLNTLIDHITDEAKRVAKINKDYLEDQINKNSDPFIKQKIYFLIAQQIETMMMAEVKENFAFKVLDPPMVPDKKIKPKRTQMVLLSLVVSLFIGIFTAFFLEYLEKNNIKVNFSFMSFRSSIKNFEGRL